jgi:hypothetical protein
MRKLDNIGGLAVRFVEEQEEHLGRVLRVNREIHAGVLQSGPERILFALSHLFGCTVLEFIRHLGSSSSQDGRLASRTCATNCFVKTVTAAAPRPLLAKLDRRRRFYNWWVQEDLSLKIGEVFPITHRRQRRSSANIAEGSLLLQTDERPRNKLRGMHPPYSKPI